MQISNSIFLPFWICRWVLWFWISSLDSSVGLQLLSSSPALLWVCSFFPGVCEWISLSRSLLFSEWALLSYILTGAWQLLKAGRWSGGSLLRWGGEVDALGKLLIKNKPFVLFSHLHTSVFDTLKHPQNAAGELWIGCYGSVTRHFETPGN